MAERCRNTQTIERSMAAHKADMGARHAAIESEALDQTNIHPRRAESGAGNRHQVCYFPRRRLAFVQRNASRFGGQVECGMFVAPHTIAGRGTKVAGINRDGKKRLSRRLSV